MSITSVLELRLNPDRIDEALLSPRAWRTGDGAVTDLPAVLTGPPRLTVAVTRDDL